jgi:hypothetical protein
MAASEKRSISTIELKVETKEKLAKLKLSDGEESWDHLLNRVYENLPRTFKATA